MIADPDCVTHDADFADRECFYRTSPLPAPYAKFLVKVVVAFHPGVNEIAPVGTVVTVRVTTKVKPREAIKWKK